MQILSAFIQRKVELYPNDDRIVMEFKVKAERISQYDGLGVGKVLMKCIAVDDPKRRQ
jgi:hypothetical protein